MRKDTRLSPLFCIASDEELGQGPRKEGTANLQLWQALLEKMM